MADEINFSATEAKFVCAILQFMRGQIDTDWEAVAALTGLKDGKSAKGTWWNLKKKKGIGGAGGAQAKGPSPSKRKAGAEENDTAADAANAAEEAMDKPEKKKRVRKPKAAADGEIKTEDGAEQEAV